jgi:hypothetical protein
MTDARIMVVSDDGEIEEMVSYRKNVTGVDHTVFISPRGNAQHAPRIKVAIDPPDSLDPRSETASVMIITGLVASGRIDAALLQQIRQFLALNRAALLDYWEYRIDTGQLHDRLRPRKDERG